MQRLAKACNVTGGRTFYYDNFDVLGPDGRRSHVDRGINEVEADVVRAVRTSTDVRWMISRAIAAAAEQHAPSQAIDEDDL
jgi:hypothetical protein